jgi:hypothetical protein
MACIRCCLVTGSRDSLPVCARTRSYSYASRIAVQYLTLIFHQHTEAKDVITSKLHHTPKANTPLHLNFRAARHYTQHYTTTVTPCLEYIRLKREPHNLYTVRLHIQFRAPGDGQWWPETCRAFLAINIVNLSHLLVIYTTFCLTKWFLTRNK